MKLAASEVVELGIQVEKNGRDFYNSLVDSSKDQKAKEIFRFLADAEADHIAAFKKILSSVSSYEPKEAYPDEYFTYMHAIASGHVFTKENAGKDIARTIKTEAAAIDMALKFEKDSILLFDQMKRLLPDKDKAVVAELINQEQGHIIRLYELKEKL